MKVNFYTLSVYVKTLLVFSLVLFYFAKLKVNVSHGVAKQNMIWEKNGHRFICKVEVCNTSYLEKYLLVKHLH
jgi:hypothetical protein